MIGNDKRNEILLALKIIKSECEEHTDCKDCPFFRHGMTDECGLRINFPHEWGINDNETWRAFR